jgi:O-antigen/teichoic acid export membrane protein
VGMQNGLGSILHRAWQDRIARGAAPMFAANLIALAVSLGKSVLIARSLGADLYGLYAYAIAVTMFAAQFLRVNSSDSIVRFVGAALATGRPSRATTFLQLGVAVEAACALLVLAAIRLVALPAVVTHPQHDVLVPMVSAYSLAIPFLLVKAPFDAGLMTLRRFRLAAGIQVAGAALELGAVLIALPQGAIPLVRALALTTAATSSASIILGAVLLWRSTGTWRGEHFRSAWREFRPYVFYGGLQATLKSLTKNLDVIVLGALRPSTDVAYYSLARGAASVLGTMAAPILRVVHPLLNDAWARTEPDKLRRLVRSYSLVAGGLALSATSVLAVGGNWLVATFYGSEYAPAAAIMRVLVVAAGLEITFGWLRKLLLIIGMPRQDWYLGLAGTALFIMALLPVVQLWGPLGLSGLVAANVIFMVGAFGWTIAGRLGRRARTGQASIAME